MSNAKISIIGNLVHDPALKRVNTSDVCNFTVAVNTTKREDGSYNANFYDCSYWNEKGRYYFSRLQKGTQVVVWGDLEVVNKKNLAGENVARLRVTVDDIRITNGIRGKEADKIEDTTEDVAEDTKKETDVTE